MTRQEVPSTPGGRITQLLEHSPQAANPLAEALSLSLESLAELLRQPEGLSLSDLVTAADVLDVPVTYLAGQTDGSHSLAVSLRLGQAQNSGVPERALQYAHMLIRRLTLLDSWQDMRPGALDELGVDYSALYKEAGQQTAGKVRDALGLGDEPIPDLVSLVERCGIPVAFQPLPRNLHGINVRDDSNGCVRRAIVVSSSDYWTRQRFTLAHELCHGLYDDEGQVIVDEVDVPQTLPELRAEAFARHLLLPVGALRAEREAAQAAREPAHALLVRLMLTYGVSRSVVLKALVDDGFVPPTDGRLAMLEAEPVRNLMDSAGQAQMWQELCEGQNEPSGSPWLVERAVQAYGEGLLDIAVVAELMGEDEPVVRRMLADAGW
ncbi:ImmA/IrrE family metallo-endopeptidase [Nonomuraea sp. NPDC003709]|uniref:ImmA/IrrE family metallo-endopeptidase n=1 Tax=Nonomuraea sp. NPDC003709 TaxID=3154450 RepID=UPI0033AE4A49